MSEVTEDQTSVPGCLFCGIVAGRIPSHKVYEDDGHIGILDIYPSVKGQCLVLPKRHSGSYVFAMADSDFLPLMSASKALARRIDERLRSLRTFMVMEGMEVDHAHIKLYPVYEVLARVAEGKADLSRYRGFITTLHGEKATPEALEATAASLVALRG